MGHLHQAFPEYREFTQVDLAADFADYAFPWGDLAVITRSLSETQGRGPLDTARVSGQEELVGKSLRPAFPREEPEPGGAKRDEGRQVGILCVYSLHDGGSRIAAETRQTRL